MWSNKSLYFLVHAEKVGLDTRGRVCENNLFDKTETKPNLLPQYLQFKQFVLDSYEGLAFNRSRFLTKIKDNGTLR